MARDLCNTCKNPLVRCLCPFIKKVEHQTFVTIIQCDKEGSHPKNTARLLPLLSEKIEVIQAINEVQMDALKSKITQEIDDQQLVTILFPSEQALTINEISHSNLPIKHLIVIDGTWRKAKKLLLTDPFFSAIKHVSLSNEYTSRYSIRKTSVENGLSTLEAIKHAIAEIEPTLCKNLGGFELLLNGINQTFIDRMPSDVKQRYKK